MRQALATLRSEGVIAVRRGARPVVLGPARTQSFAELQSFTSWARALREEPSGRVIVHPVVTWLAMSTAIIIWHFPRFYELALRSPEWDTLVIKNGADQRKCVDEVKKRLVAWTEE